MRKLIKKAKRLFKKRETIIHSHYYENSRGEITFGTIVKTGRGVVYLFNEYGCTVKLKSTDINKIPRD
jgi:hypothetical protein